MKAPTPAKPKLTVKRGRAIKDCATGNWDDEFEIIPEDGIPTRVLVPREEADSASGLGRHLSKKGARLPRMVEERKLMLDAIIESNPTRIMHKIEDTGWQMGKGHNVCHWLSVGKRLIGAPTGEIGYLPPSLIATSRAKAFAKCGTLDGWKARIATVATLSTCMTVAISAAFAAPLLRLSGLPNFSLLIGGQSRTGKTSALLTATSVFGIGHEKYLPTWAGTGLGLLEAAAGFGDIVFPVNEVGAKKGKRSGAYEGLRDLFAQYAEGSDRERHSSHQPDEARRFHGICIATAERSIAGYAKLAGEDRDDGELFRAIDVIAVRDGKKTVLDLAPDTFDQTTCLKTLHKDLEAQHGTAIAPYSEHLVLTGDREVKRRIDALVQEFVSHMPAAAHDNVADQMATNFGLLYAGAILGIESGVLPWTKDHVRVTLKRGFDDALEYSKPIDHLALALEILKENLRERLVERKPDSRFGRKDHAGFWKTEGDVRNIVVNTSRFRSWFANDLQVSRALEWLSSEGHLKQDKNAIRGVVTQKDLDGVTLHWPDGKVVRSFAFRDPFPELSVTDAAPPIPRAGARSRKVGTGSSKRRHARLAASQGMQKVSSAPVRASVDRARLGNREQLKGLGKKPSTKAAMGKRRPFPTLPKDLEFE